MARRPNYAHNRRANTAHGYLYFFACPTSAKLGVEIEGLSYKVEYSVHPKTANKLAATAGDWRAEGGPTVSYRSTESCVARRWHCDNSSPKTLWTEKGQRYYAMAYRE